jgi:hypothetical protein
MGVRELRRKRIKEAGYTSEGAYRKFLLAPKGSVKEQLEAEARAKGKTVGQLIAEKRKKIIAERKAYRKRLAE